MSEKASVIIVGCGCPLRSMGWYHAVQLLDNRVPSAKLTCIVEPWYMSDAAKGTPGYDEFHTWKTEMETKHGISFYATTNAVPATITNGNEKRLGIISARTADNPKLFTGCIDDLKCHCIYLEKPGAPSVLELEAMRDKAKSNNVTVFMGFNKNVSSYLTKTRDFAAIYPSPCDVTFLHNNNYKNEKSELAECFERNAEGMLKNMAIHELAILVTYYNVTVDTIESVQADKEYSSCQTLQGPSSGKEFTDFDKLKFKITTKSGVQVNVAADRCGGDDSVGIVTINKDGTTTELARFVMPDEETVAAKASLQAKYGDAMPYFFAQDPDYCALKELVAKNCVDGSPAEGVATIDGAIDTLKVAEYLTPILQEQLK